MASCYICGKKLGYYSTDKKPIKKKCLGSYNDKGQWICKWPYKKKS